ncbi:MAG: ABC transporter permease, partial [Nitrospinota bacterium]
MTRYFLKALSAHLRGGGALYVLTVLGVALGVASALSIQIINRNALGAFEAGIEAISGEADLSVLGRTPTFPERLYADVLAEEGVARAWPLYRIDVALADREDAFLEVVGVDFFASPRLPWDGSPGDLSEALVRPGWVAVAPALAEEMGWAVGDAFEVTSGSKRVDLVVGALVDFQRLSPLASRKLAVMDIAQAQSLLGRPGEI